MKYVFVKQHDSNDCAAACLSMICLYYKKDVSISKLRDLMGTDINGTNLIGLTKCAKSLGFKTQAVRIESDKLRNNFSLPCIAYVKTKKDEGHFVVIFKIKHNHLIIGDPGKGLIKISKNQFYQDFLNYLLILVPSQRFVKDKKKNSSILKHYVRILLPQKKLIFFSILASLLLTIFSLISSLFNKIIMDEILPYKLRESFISFLIIFTIISITQIIVLFIRKWMLIYLSQKLNIPLIINYFQHIYNLPMKFFATRKTGDIMTRFSDATVIMNILTNITISLGLDITMVIITGGILSQMNMKLFGITILITIINVFLVCFFKEPYKAINEESMYQTSKLNSQIIESLRAIETVKVNCAEDEEMRILEENYIDLLKCQFKEGMFSSIQGVFSGAASTLGNMGIMYIGILQVMNNDITIGSLMAFMTISTSFMGPINKLVNMQLQIQEANISMNRLTEILDYDNEQEDSSDLICKIDNNHNKILEFKDVTFCYGNRQPVLDNISFTVERGKKIAIIGESGSGKSTIAKLILKYYLPEHGEILFDGINLEAYDNKALRNSISYVPQAVDLFSRSILDNIKLSKPNAAFKEAIESAKVACAHEFIEKLPLQYFTILEESGNGLSGGEKQRIAIARALLKENDIYIFDECTSNLDLGTEKQILNKISNHLKDKTMIFIAHRLSTIKDCDCIYVLDRGKIVEQGKHEELLLIDGIYRKLWEMQEGL